MREAIRLLPRGEVRRRPWRSGSRQMFVPLEPVDRRGDERIGTFTMPAKYAVALPHSNEALTRDRLAREKVDVWVRWRAHEGDYVKGDVDVTGPFPLPTPNADTQADPTVVEFRTRAFFVRDDPVRVPLDTFLDRQDSARRHGVSLDTSTVVDSHAGQVPVAHITPTGPSHNPLQIAKARRDRLGLRHSDLVIGDYSRPLSEETV